ncbi:hypothetical protein Syun_025369 [Stephania yunnanensis]|uniref:Uncharacterized protein n=1 Tax=Stephania yunnanensis TaxID=152371 RepID=A0AAP0HUV8_9MAGN
MSKDYFPANVLCPSDKEKRKEIACELWRSLEHLQCKMWIVAVLRGFVRVVDPLYSALDFK